MLPLLSFLGLLFFITGSILILVYYIKLMILAFNTSFLWGLCYVFLPSAALVFAIKHRHDDEIRHTSLHLLTCVGVCVGGLLAFLFLPRSVEG